jgi:YceI-like protein
VSRILKQKVEHSARTQTERQGDKMRRIERNFVLAQLALSPALFAWQTTPTAIDMQPESKVWVEGTSSVRGYKCNAVAMNATLQSAGGGAVQAILAGEKAVGGADLTIDVAQLECGNGTMNGHMRKAIKAEANPAILFKLTSYELTKNADTLRIAMTGDLTLAGTQKTITLQALAKDGGNGTLLVEGSHELNMRDYGINPPKLMLGTLKVHDKVKVGFSLLLKD